MIKGKATVAPPDVITITRGNKKIEYRLSKDHDGTRDAGLNEVIEAAAEPTASMSSKAISSSVQQAPVYESVAGGAKVVATGRFTIRTKPDADSSRLNDELDEMGFVVVRRYPNAMVVAPGKIDVADALSKGSELEHLSSVVRAEPQLIAERAKKN